MEHPPLPAVMIVDDDPLFRLLTRLLLESRGCTVSVAEGCEEALRVFDAAKPAVAIVDMVMPGVDGLGTISALRAQSDDLQFIACSGHDADLFRAGLAKLEVSHFLAKPFTVEALIAMMQRAVGSGGG
ncbi:MAG TPA: response regulator, partial [Chthoniobacteraceae bacterium]|nr:response regulator [Chthoniobacteraceae bacterium]